METTIKDIAAAIKAAPMYAMDIETTSLKPLDATVLGVSLSLGEGPTTWWIPFNNKDISPAIFAEVFAEVLADTTKICIMHNAKFDTSCLALSGIVVKNRIIDTMVAVWILDPSKAGSSKLGLKAAVLELLGHKMVTYAESALSGDLFGKDVADYAKDDALQTFRLWLKLEQLIKARDSSGELLKAFYELEMPMVAIATEMEATGVMVNRDYLKTLSRQMGIDLMKIQEDVRTLAGHPVLLSSSDQVRVLILDELKMEPNPAAKKGKSGKVSMDYESLQYYKGKHAVIDKILKHREQTKLLTTYVRPLLEFSDKYGDHRVHVEFWITGTDIGRWTSSGGVNLQNQPREGGIRQAFIAPPGKTLVCADYGQLELRMAAHVTGDAALVLAYSSGADVHKQTSEACGCTRQVAKCVTGDTRIAVPGKGLLRIDSLSAERGVDTFAATTVPVLLECGPVLADQFYSNGVQKTVRVVTAGGRIIEGSAKHRVKDASGQWQHLGCLKVGDVLRVIPTPVFGHEIQELQYNFWTNGRSPASSRSPVIRFDEVWAEFIGLVMGDGSVNKNAVQFCAGKQDAEVMQHFVAVVQKLGFDVKSFEDGRGLLRASFGNRNFVRLLHAIGFYGRHGKVLRVPDIVFRSPKTVVAAFLRGLFETDGHVKAKRGLTWTTKDEGLAADVVQLITQFGIWTGLKREWNKQYKKWYYTVRVFRSGVAEFASSIGLISTRKNAELQKWAAMEPLAPRSREWVDTVERTEAGEGHLFDLSVPEHHAYAVGGGLVSHNTINFGSLYGASPRKIANVLWLDAGLRVSEDETRVWMDKFWEKYGGLKNFHDTVRGQVKAGQMNYRTITGRIKNVKDVRPKGDSTGWTQRQKDRQEIEAKFRVAAHFQISGSSADVMMISMRNIHRAILGNRLVDKRWNDVKFLVQVHDEIVLEAPDELAQDVLQLVKTKMETCVTLKVPLVADCHLGKDWLQAKGK